MSGTAVGGRHDRGTRLLTAGIAATLRHGTLVTIGLVAAGYAWVLLTGDPGPGRASLGEVLAAGGPWPLVGLGLLGLTLVPVAMLAVAAIGFHLRGERRMRLAATLVAALLLATLAAAALLTRGA